MLTWSDKRAIKKNLINPQSLIIVDFLLAPLENNPPKLDPKHKIQHNASTSPLILKIPLLSNSRRIHLARHRPQTLILRLTRIIQMETFEEREKEREEIEFESGR